MACRTSDSLTPLISAAVPTRLTRTPRKLFQAETLPDDRDNFSKGTQHVPTESLELCAVVPGHDKQIQVCVRSSANSLYGWMVALALALAHGNMELERKCWRFIEVIEASDPAPCGIVRNLWTGEVRRGPNDLVRLGMIYRPPKCVTR